MLSRMELFRAWAIMLTENIGKQHQLFDSCNFLNFLKFREVSIWSADPLVLIIDHHFYIGRKPFFQRLAHRTGVWMRTFSSMVTIKGILLILLTMVGRMHGAKRPRVGKILWWRRLLVGGRECFGGSLPALPCPEGYNFENILLIYNPTALFHRRQLSRQNPCSPSRFHKGHYLRHVLILAGLFTAIRDFTIFENMRWRQVVGGAW